MGQFGDPRTVEITVADPKLKCCFCGRHEVNAAEWGSLLMLDDIVTHHFCLVRYPLVDALLHFDLLKSFSIFVVVFCLGETKW
jgi:hypothetical protein